MPHPLASAAEMLAMGQATGLSIAAMKRANEVAAGIADLDARLDRIWEAMSGCIDRRLRQDGILPGGLKVRRQAKAIHEQLLAERGRNLSHRMSPKTGCRSMRWRSTRKTPPGAMW